MLPLFLMAASGHIEAALVDGFGKTAARVDEYFTLKKVEADWALEWARPAGLRAPGQPAWAPSGPFRLHLSRATCSKIQDKIENGQVRVPSGGLVHESSR